MSDDIIEFTEALIDVANVTVPQFDVRQAESDDSFSPGLDLTRRKIYPEKGTVR